MVGLLKNIFSRKKPVVSIGEINPKPKVKRKVVNKEGKQLRVIKVNGTTQFYSVRLNEYEHLHLSVLGKKFVKEHPEVVKFISENIFYSNKLKFSFENQRLKMILSEFQSKGSNHNLLYNMSVTLKDKNQSKNFFVKITNNNFLANNEFLANQAFQKYGVNTIKPHFAFTSTRKSVIVYDFSNLSLLSDGVLKGLLTPKEIKEIGQKINSITLNEALPTTNRNYKKSIGDYDRYTNIFYKREKNGKIELYFTDLLIGYRIPGY